MRCFIAIDFSEEIKEELGRVQKELPDAKLALVSPENVHLTLKFLGEITPEKVEEVKKALQNIKFKKFYGSLKGVGYFPSKDFIRVVWVGAEPKEKFLEIFNFVEEEMDKIGFNKEQRKFENHATLARVKFVKDKESFIESLNKIQVSSVNFVVDKIKLKKSTLTPEGPVYEDLFVTGF